MVDEEQVEIGLKEPYTYKSFHSELQKIVKVKAKLQRIEAEMKDRIKAFYQDMGQFPAKIAPQLKCYKNASRLNRYNFPTDNAIDFLFSILHSEMV